MKSVKNFYVLTLIIIFVLALFLRFQYFPDNIYFGFDQARDAFASQSILQGDFKIVGPPTGVDGMFHGPLYYYFYAPIYLVSGGNPEFVSAFLRIVNAAGIFLIFLIGWALFNKKVGLIGALLYAISFEQTQFALYFNHPSLAVISISLFYLGLAYLFFRKQKSGLLLATFSLGLSIQFEFVLVYLPLIFLILLIIFRKFLPKIDIRTCILSIGLFLLSTSSFLISESIFHFRAIKTLLILFSTTSHGISGGQVWNNFSVISQRFVNDNLLGFEGVTIFLCFSLIIFFLIKIKENTIRPQLIFLLTWFLGGLIPYIGNNSSSPLYYYGVGAGLSLLVFTSYLIDQVYLKNKLLALLLLVVPMTSNLALITTYNPHGSISTINVQSGMLLSDEKKVIDFIYQQAQNKPFAINALSMPMYVSTTWSYLFKWYGQSHYGYLPVWGGQMAAGYPGSLENISARSELPDKTFLIIEPTRGIRPNLVDSFIQEEGYFSKVSDEKRIGNFIVQVRVKK